MPRFVVPLVVARARRVVVVEEERVLVDEQPAGVVRVAGVVALL